MPEEITRQDGAPGSIGVVSVLTLVALVVRFILMVHVRVIETDSAYYGYLAREFARGNYLDALNPAWPPFYPFLAGLVSRLNGDVAFSARIVSVIAGALLVPVVFRLTRSVFGYYTAIVASTIIAFHPRLVFYSELFLTESLYVFLFAAAIMLLVGSLAGDPARTGGVRRRAPLLAALSGAFFFLLFATRPEGLILFAATAFFLLISSVVQAFRVRSTLSTFAFLAIGFLILFVPYSSIFHSTTGRILPGEKGRYNFYVTYKRDYIKNGIEVDTGWINRIPPGWFKVRGSGENRQENESLSVQDRYRSDYYITRYLDASLPKVVKHVLVTFFRNLMDKLPSCEYHPLFLLTILGIVLPRKRYRIELLFGFTIVVFVLALSFFFPLRRFFVVLLPLLVVWAAVGFVQVMKRIPLYSMNGFGGLEISDRFKGKAALVRLLSSLMVFIVLFASYAYARRLVVDRDYPDEYRAAGEWLKANCSFTPVISSRKPEVSFYADGYFLPLPHMRPEELAAWMRKEGVTHVVVDDRIMQRSHPELTRMISGEKVPRGLRVVYDRKVGGHTVIIFALSDD